MAPLDRTTQFLVIRLLAERTLGQKIRNATLLYYCVWNLGRGDSDFDSLTRFGPAEGRDLIDIESRSRPSL